jgi:hypothetical protein
VTHDVIRSRVLQQLGVRGIAGIREVNPPGDQDDGKWSLYLACRFDVVVTVGCCSGWRVSARRPASTSALAWSGSSWTLICCRRRHRPSARRG